MTQWTRETPGDGDMDALNTINNRLSDNGTNTRYVSSALGKHLNALPSIWTGDGANAWANMVAAFKPDLDTASTAADAATTAITTYTTEVADIKHEADDLNKKIDGKINEASADDTECTYDWSSDSPHVTCRPRKAFLSAPLTESDQKKADRKADGYASEIKGLLKKFDGLAERRTTADNTIASTLNGLIPSSWSAEKAALVDLGITNPMDMTEKNIADKIADYAEKVAGQNAPLTAEQLKAFNDIFNAYQYNEDIMNDVFTQLGGEGTVNLVDLFGRTAQTPPNPEEFSIDAIVELAKAFREGFATGTQHWNAEQAKTFADDMLANLYPGDGRLNATSFLFDGPIIGPELSLAAANAIDERERTGYTDPETGQRRPFTADPNDRAYGLGSTNVGTGGWTLLDLTHPGDPDAARAALDPAATIFDMLANHSAQASEFLSDPDNGADRIDYWYGVRDWSEYDKFEGAANLWLATERTAGGPTDASHYDQQAWETAATIATRVMQALDDNASFSTDGLSDKAAVAIAAAIGIQLPGLTECPLTDASEQNKDLFQTTDLFGNGVEQAYANVPSDLLARLLGQISGNSAGADTITDAAEKYRDALVAAASVVPDVSVSGLLDRIASLQGLIDGSRDGADLSDAADRDQDVQDAINAAGDLLGAIPIPGVTLVSKAATYAAQYVQNYTVIQLINAGKELAASAWGGAYDVVNNNQNAAENDRETNMTNILAVLAWQLCRPDGVPDPATYDEPTADDDFAAWRKKYKDAINNAINGGQPAAQGYGTASTLYQTAYDAYKAAAEDHKK